MQLSEKRSVRILSLAGDVVSAYVTNNSITVSDLPKLIGHVHAALSGLMNGATADTSVKVNEKATPTQIRESIKRDALISFIDGKSYKMLKRHLASHGLNPWTYCERYGLPADYPMVASGYAELRSRIAKGTSRNEPIDTGTINTALSESRTPMNRANRRDLRKSLPSQSDSKAR